MSEKLTLLHLSDLHFGYDADDTAKAQRTNTLNRLLDTLKQLDAEWRPGLVAITGDIGWKGVEADYEQAKAWLTKLLTVLELTPKELILCPGNHDLDRGKTSGMEPPPSVQKADDWLKIEKLENFKRFFRDYHQLNVQLNLTPLNIKGQAEYLFGQREYGGVRFVVLNSAWFCRGDKDRNHLWLGLPQLEILAANNALANPRNYDDGLITIALFHHPPAWLNEAEQESYGERAATFHYLADRCHLMLCGHAHGNLRRPDRISARAWLFVGGAAYHRPQYRNNFTLFQINTDSRTLKRRKYEFNAGSDEWRELALKEFYDLKYQTSSEPVTLVELPLKISNVYKKWLIDHCLDPDFTKIIGESPMLQIGLPEIFIPLLAVAPPNTMANREKIEQFEHFKDRNWDIAKLIDKNPILLIEGPAGSGKTTLIKHYVHQLIHSHPHYGPSDCLPVLIFLKDIHSFDFHGMHPNSGAFESLVKHYLKKMDNGLDLKTVQSFCHRRLALFLLDGLDEVKPELRAFLVEACAGFKRSNTNVRVVLTGRPHGVDASVLKWFKDQHVRIAPLNMQQIETFVRKWFAHIFSRNSQTIRKTADDMIGEIKAHATIDQLTETPLMLTAICLLYHDDRELPGQRAELYHKFVNNLLHRRFKEPEKVRNFLMELAYDMHKRGVKGIDRIHAIDVLCRKYERITGEAESEFCRRVDARFDEIEPKCALLQYWPHLVINRKS